MDGEQRSWLIGILMTIVGVVTLAFLVGDCSNKARQIEQQAQIECIRAHGNWANVSGDKDYPKMGCQTK